MKAFRLIYSIYNFPQYYNNRKKIYKIMNIWIESEKKFIVLKDNFLNLKELKQQIKDQLNLQNNNIELFYVQNNARIYFKSFQQITRVRKLGLRIEVEISVNRSQNNDKINREIVYSIASSIKGYQQTSEKRKQNQLQVRQYNIQYMNKNSENIQEEYVVEKIKKNTEYQYQYLIQNTSSWGELNQKTLKSSSKAEVIQIIKNEIIQKKQDILKDRIEQWSNLSVCEEEVRNKYRCYICDGKGIRKSKNHHKDKKCHVCNGDKYIDTSHPLIKFLDELIYDRVNEIFKFKIIPQSKLQNQTENINNSIQQSPYAVTFLQVPEKQIKCEFGDQYSWRLYFYNSGLVDWPHKKIHLYEIYPKHKKILEIRSLKRNQKYQIAIILKPNNVGIDTVIYKFGYINEVRKLVYFGQEFSYQLLTIQEQKLEPKFFEDIIEQQTNLQSNLLINSNQTQSMRATRPYQLN